MVLKDDSYVKEVALNKTIDLLKDTKKKRKIKDWIGVLSRKAGEFKQDTLERLINKGILKKQEHKILWIIPYNKYPTDNLSPENKVRERLNGVMLKGEESEPRDIMLLSLIEVSDLTREAFRNKEDYKVVKKKIKEVTQDVKISSAINKSIREIQAAIMIALTTMIVVTNVINSNS